MTVLPFRTSTYARNIYMYGTTRFADIPAEYVQPVKQFAADTYYIDDIGRAFTNGWISQAEHDETLALKTADDPQYRPASLASVEEI